MKKGDLEWNVFVAQGKEKAKLLYEIKVDCIKNKKEKPKWWYRQRNVLHWIDDDGSFLMGYDLGGF